MLGMGSGYWIEVEEWCSKLHIHPSFLVGCCWCLYGYLFMWLCNVYTNTYEYAVLFWYFILSLQHILLEIHATRNKAHGICNHLTHTSHTIFTFYFYMSDGTHNAIDNIFWYLLHLQWMLHIRYINGMWQFCMNIYQ